MAGNKGTALVLGTFDGVHIAHKALVKEASALGRGLTVTALTFDKVPGSVLGKDGKERQILTCSDKVELLKRAGVEEVVVLGFDDDLSSMPAEDFFERIVLGRCRAKLLAVGHDYRFGKGGRGDVALLEVLCKRAGVDLVVLDEISIGGTRISSTEIRRRICAGEPEAAARMLGRVHFLKATATSGRIVPDPAIELPPAGVGFRTKFFTKLPVLEDFGCYDASFWVVDRSGGQELVIEPGSCVPSEGELYLLFGPRSGPV